MRQTALFYVLAILGGLAPAPAALPPDLPVRVTSFGAASSADGALYCYGGHSGQRHRYNREEVHGTFSRWQAGAEEWEVLPGDEPAQGASLLAVPGGVVRIGGMAARNERGGKQELWSSDTAARYDIASGKWLALPKLPKRRSSHDSTLVGDVLYVMGGWHMEAGQKTVWHETYLTLDLKQPEAGWKEHPQPFKRRGLAVQALGRLVYAIGGMTDDEEMVTQVAILDTATGEWSEGPALPADKVGGFGFAAVALEGRFFASGAPGDLLELHGGQWVTVARLKHPRFFHRLLPGGKDRLIALGGESRDGIKAPPEEIVLPTPGKTASAVADWPRFQGPRGNSTTPETGWRKDWPPSGPRVVWQAELGKGLSSFAVMGSRVFASGNNGADQDSLSCLDLETGQTVWQYTLAVPTKPHEMSIVPPGPAATPTVADGRVYCLSREGDLLCLDTLNGKVIWRKHLVKDLSGKRPVYGYANSPAVDEGRLYLDVGREKGASGSTACVDAVSGEVVWQTGEGEAGYATPYITERDGMKVLVMFKGEALELRQAKDGKLLARHPTETRDFCNCATPVRLGDLLFISHTGNMGARVLDWKGQNLNEVWTDRDLGLLFNSGLPWQDSLMVFNDQKRGVNDLRLVELATGKARWQTADVDKGTGLICDDGHALILTSKGELILSKVSTEKLDVLQRVQVLGGKCWAQPVLSHGRILCRNNDGNTVCLDVRQ
ncbi:MAG: PQQ-binding-like beta-propeller repeat protein [Prosthecobacter sp.]|nr:PQQ-binding-like beta-propeller repeat protein [Prosthecobacter sp.]